MYTDEEKRETERLRKAFAKLDQLITRAEVLAIIEANSKKQDEDRS